MKNKDDIESLTRAAKQAFNSEPPNYEAAFLAYSEAIGLLQFNKGSEAESSEVFFQRGRTLMAMGKFPEAIYDFTWAIKNVTPIKEESQKQKSNLMDSIKEDKEIP